MVAMSGGVDSSVAAALLRRQGHGVEGAYMKNWVNEPTALGDCPWQRDIEDARAVAAALDIPFRVVNLMAEYRRRVVDYLLAGYRAGVTPNPDAMCNREIKFGVFLEWALAEGFAAVATGHYARREPAADGGWVIREGIDKNKDQSYFLALLDQRQVAHARFPLGDLRKPAVRALAREFGLPTAAKKDSQGICFIGQVRMADFLAGHLPDRPGDIVDGDGRRLGSHRGLHYFTLGQRRGLGVACPVPNKAYVVVAKRPATDELVIGIDDPATPGLYARACRLADLHWLWRPVDRPRDLLARPRYRAPAVSARWVPTGPAAGELTFAAPQRALAPLQICALYDGDLLLGGGFFAAGGGDPAPG